MNTSHQGSRLLAAAGVALLCAQPAWSAAAVVELKAPAAKAAEAKAREMKVADVKNAEVKYVEAKGADADDGAGPAAAAPVWLDQLQVQMKKMEAIAARYGRSADATERQKLWSEYQKEMWTGLQLVHQQADTMLRAGCASPAPGLVKTVAVAGGPSAASADARFERLERRLDAMQTMMNRVIVEGLGLELPPDEAAQ